MSKIKRKITVNLTTKSKTLPAKNRPSVFERLGTKATTTGKEYCHHWAQSGSCPYGKGCKYSVTHTLISPSKQRAAKTQSVSQKRRHAKDGHKRPPHQKPPQSHEEWEQWDPDELEDADPDDLEKRRQELQRELELQMKMENKAKKKEKKIKKDSSPSSDSSSSSSESSSSSDESSSSSSSSAEARRKKGKKPKIKRNTSTSSEERARNKLKPKAKRNSSKSGTREKQTKKCLKPVTKTKSPSPVRPRKKSETPPLKAKLATSTKKISTEKSPRPQSRTSLKEKHRTPSPKPSKEKEREKEREREREREKEKEREREREREREKEKEREREREKERERERAKERAKEREREKEKEYKKKEALRSPKRDSRPIKDSRKIDTPDSSLSRDRKVSPGRGKGSNSRRDHKSPVKDDRRSDKRDDRGRSRGKDGGRSSGCGGSGDKSRPKDSSTGGGSSKRDSRDRDRERERERERRLAREEREAAREKEREEALARCQERQRERERLKELQKKEEEQRRRERTRREDRGLDKPTGDRVERLLPPLEERVPPSRKAHSSERDRSERGGRGGDRHDRGSLDRSSRKSPDRRSDLGKDRSYDRGYDRNRDREHDRVDREYGGGHRGDRDKDYSSPYERNARHEDRRYMDIDDHYADGIRDDARLYGEDRRGRRDLWDMREDRGDPERERELDHRSRYGRDESLKGGREGDWDREYPTTEHDWASDRNRRPVEWDNRDTWDSLDHKQVEDEWRHYNRSMDSWTTDDRRRWQADWRERDRERDRSRPRSSASHHVDTISTSIPPSEDSNHETRRKEPSSLVSIPRQEQSDVKPTVPPSEASDPGAVKEAAATTSQKRTAEDGLDSPGSAKRVCIKQEAQPVLEDDLSEISDDADEILNRDEEIQEMIKEESASVTQPDASTVDTTSLKDQNTSTASQKSQSPAPKSPSKTVKEESIDEENMDLDFEEISEDELEEESKVKGLGDALGVDWASLVAESRPRAKPTSSAKLRWESHNVLVHLGISVALAGEDLVKDILREHVEAEQKEQQTESIKPDSGGVKIKEEPQEASLNGIKQEPKEEEVEEKPYLELEEKEVVISHPIAMIQVADREKQAVRKALFTNVGPHRRALAARRDLTIRRHLSNLPMTDMYVEAPKRHDPELLKIATQLFERCL